MTEDDFMGSLYQRFPVTIEKGIGAHVWDINGKEYIDCMAGYGVAIVGHQNKRVVNAIKEQVDKIITVHSSLYNKTREEFLKTLIGLAPKGLTQVHLNNSGAEAIEAAIKFSRKFTGKKGMVAMKGSYHGKSLGALSITFNPKYKKAFEPLIEKVSFASFGDIESLRSTIDQDTAFVILEPIQGESGINVAPDGFLQQVREICNEKGILLIFDEIQAGLGRTGRLWACDHWNTAPDILCLAKGIAGGVPMGATIVRQDILASMSKGEHSSTFGGNPLSCAAGIATLHALTQDGLIENSEKMGNYFREGLEKLKAKHTIIREIRGKGLMIGVELKFEVKDILMNLLKEGVLMLYSGRNILRILPPLVITREDITKVLETLDSVLTQEEAKNNVQ
ncbi:MAG: acetylornithine/succinylornithine family transaminase [Nitrosarchaeum sp.]|nr:acetylornithine/succinylornithine family transaminase [Nitrosarchaeum sp.]MBP0119754.1 acetylornithine/succinylornithine family transaminase [Nitrosarchaeum sp.]